MPRLYIVPGFLSSTLSNPTIVGETVWVSYPVLFEGGLDLLRLDAEGVGPGQPGGIALQASGLVRPYWDQVFAMFFRDLAPRGWRGYVFAWDWRLDLRGTGRDLAALIRRQETTADPCTLVCHSTGGLVARVAWADLLTTAQQDLVRRIINLSTPDHGTYSSPAAWCGAEDWYDYADQLGGLFNTAWPLVQPIAPPDFTKRNLVTIMQTWPCMYQLFPVLDVDDSPPDPLRREVYEGSNWPSTTRPSPAHLAMTRGPWGDFMRSAASFPPRWVTTNIWSSGYFTPAVLLDPRKLGGRGAIGLDGDGDATVMRTSSIGSPGAQIEVTASHQDIMRHTADSGVLLAAILDPRGPHDPTPPLFILPGVAPGWYLPTPLGPSGGGLVPPGQCNGGDCRC